MEVITISTDTVKDAMTMLKQTSRTFYIPISSLDAGLKEAVASAYLCMRAIDEIEDHENLVDALKIELLAGVHGAFQSSDIMDAIQKLLSPYTAQELPEVSLRLAEWLHLCPSSARPIIEKYIAKMSLQMSEWVQKGWSIRTEEDLDGYTYSVAGMVGEMLSELWQWNDGTQSDRDKAIAFGRGLQAVNILRNQAEDAKRGVSFFPEGWGFKEMQQYTRRNLQLADAYIADLKQGPALKFCKVPLALAHATLNLLSAGGSKLTRDAVLKIVSKVT